MQCVPCTGKSNGAVQFTMFSHCIQLPQKTLKSCYLDLSDVHDNGHTLYTLCILHDPYRTHEAHVLEHPLPCASYKVFPDLLMVTLYYNAST